MAEQKIVALVRATRHIDRGKFIIPQGAEGELVSVTGPRSSTDTLRVAVIWDWVVAQGDDRNYVPAFKVQVDGIPGDAVVAVRPGLARTSPEVPPVEPVEGPAPTVTSINPVSMPSKGAVRQLQVHGTHFTPDSVVLFNLAEEPTTYVSPELLSITLTPAGAVDGVYPVSVVGAAEVLQFEFTPAQRNELTPPTVTGLSPTTAAMGGAAVTLHVYGAHFTPDTVILFNHGEEPTTYVSDVEVTTLVNPATASGPWTVPVSVMGAAESVDFAFTDPNAAGTRRRR